MEIWETRLENLGICDITFQIEYENLLLPTEADQMRLEGVDLDRRYFFIENLFFVLKW